MDKILVNIDFKHNTSSLMDKVARLAQQYSAYVELFCCCYNRAIKHGYVFDKAEEQKAEHAYIRQMEAKLERLAQTLQQQNIEVGVDVAWDRHIAEGVVRKVLRFEPDLVLHSVQPHSRIGHYLFAPVDWQLARKCPKPVLFVKERDWSEHPRVVACIDPLHSNDKESELDRALLKWTNTFTREGVCELRVLHCYNALPHEAIFDEHLVTDYEALQDRVEKDHFQRCNQLLGEFGLSTDSPMVEIIKGETDLTISNYAANNGIDIIAMGAVARSVFDSLLVGSTMEYVVDHVDCDVMLVKSSGFVCPVTE